MSCVTTVFGFVHIFRNKSDGSIRGFSFIRTNCSQHKKKFTKAFIIEIYRKIFSHTEFCSFFRRTFFPVFFCFGPHVIPCVNVCMCISHENTDLLLKCCHLIDLLLNECFIWISKQLHCVQTVILLSWNRWTRVYIFEHHNNGNSPTVWCWTSDYNKFNCFIMVLIRSCLANRKHSNWCKQCSSFKYFYLLEIWRKNDAYYWYSVLFYTCFSHISVCLVFF